MKPIKKFKYSLTKDKSAFLKKEKSIEEEDIFNEMLKNKLRKKR